MFTAHISGKDNPGCCVSSLVHRCVAQPHWRQRTRPNRCSTGRNSSLWSLTAQHCSSTCRSIMERYWFNLQLRNSYLIIVVSQVTNHPVIMSTSSSSSFRELLPELFPVIIEHLPVVYRPSILRSLALTCHRIHDVVFPELTYDSVWLVGEDQALTTLNMLTARAELVTAQDIQKQGNPSPSHCIHHICLDSSIKTPTHVPNSLDALQKLIDVDGLRHLSSLTLRVDPTGHLKLPSSFFTSLETKCPN